MRGQEKKRIFTLKRILLLLAVFVLISIIGGSCYMVSYALTPDKTIEKKNELSEVFMEENYPFYAEWRDSLIAESAIKDTFITNDENIKLHAQYIYSAQPTSKTAVIVHGYTDNATRMMMIAYMYNKDLGFNVLLPDLHYHGKSEGKAIQMGWKDRLDVIRWIDIANEIFGKNTEMVVHGISIGAATTMMVSGEESVNDCVKVYVEDCGYTSVWEQFSKEMKEDFSLPEFPLLYTADWLCRAKYGWGFKEASAINQVMKCKKPMFFIHGDKDDYVPTNMVYQLYEAKKGDKQIWVVKDAEHAVSYQENKEEYTQRVKDFIYRYIQ